MRFAVETIIECGKVPELEKSVALSATKTGRMENLVVCGQSLDRVNALVAHIAFLEYSRPILRCPFNFSNLSHVLYLNSRIGLDYSIEVDIARFDETKERILG